MAKNIKAPDEPDDASAGRKFGKNEPGMPEMLGSGIRVTPLPIATPDAAKNLKMDKGLAPANVGKDVKMQKLAKGGMTASKRADGCCVKGKTKGRMV